MCCSNCGAKLPKSALFCPNCGAARQSAGGGKPPRRSRLPLWIALGVLALALIVSGLLLAPKLFPRAGESAPTPARPDAPESFRWPLSPYRDTYGVQVLERDDAATRVK